MIMQLSWHQQRAVTIAAAAIRSGKDVQHGIRNCDCCGETSFGPFDDDFFKCSTCEDTECDPAQTWHCFTGYCDGSGCSYSGECHLPRDFEAEYSTEFEDRELTVEVYKLGGGTVGHAYTNDWAYRVSRDGEPFYAGSDLHTGTPRTHAEVAVSLISFLESDHIIPELV